MSKEMGTDTCTMCGVTVNSKNTKSCGQGAYVRGRSYVRCGKCYLQFRREMRARLGRQ